MVVEYYVLKRDERLGTLEAKFSYSEALRQGYEQAASYEIISVEGQGRREYGCILTHPMLLISEEVRKVLLHFEQGLECKTVGVFDQEIQSQIQYYMPKLPQVKGEIQSNKPFVYSVPTGALESLPFFQLEVYRNVQFIVRLDVAEKVLREGLYGVSLEKIKINEV
jgi:hypothetical protein